MENFVDATSFATQMKKELAATESESEASQEESKQEESAQESEPVKDDGAEEGKEEESTSEDKKEEEEDTEENAPEAEDDGSDSEEKPESLEAFAAKQREWRIKERSLKTSLKEAEEKLEKVSAKTSQVEGFFDEFRKNPVKFLERYRPDVYEQWTLLKAGVESPKSEERDTYTADPRIESLAKQIEEMKKAQESNRIESQKSKYINEANKILKKQDFSTLVKYCNKLGLDPAKESLDYAIEVARRDRVSLAPMEAAQGLQDWVNRQKKAFVEEEKKQKKEEKKVLQKPKSVISPKMVKSSGDTAQKKQPLSKEEWSQLMKQELRKLQQ